MEKKDGKLTTSTIEIKNNRKRQMVMIMVEK
jgi:hypothetical protein